VLDGRVERATRMANHRERKRDGHTDRDRNRDRLQRWVFKQASKKDYSSGENYCTEHRKIIIINTGKHS